MYVYGIYGFIFMNGTKIYLNEDKLRTEKGTLIDLLSRGEEVTCHRF